MVFVRNGDDAIDYLGATGQYSHRDKLPGPDLVLLDLKMPGSDGFDVLRWLQNHPRSDGLRAVVMTACGLPEDVTLAMSLGAKDFRVKPGDIRELSAMLTDIWRCWLVPSSGPTN